MSPDFAAKNFRTTPEKRKPVADLRNAFPRTVSQVTHSVTNLKSMEHHSFVKGKMFLHIIFQTNYVVNEFPSQKMDVFQ